MEIHDDDLVRFEAEGAAPLPAAGDRGYVERAGARIWYAAYGAGRPAILLHGGLGNSGNWGYQVPVLVASGYRAVAIDSRGHGRSTRDARPFSYELLASDVLAVMDALGIERAALVGWSDGACAALVLASQAPERVAGVFFFACNMDPSGTKEFVFTPVVGRCLSRHQQDYRQLSATPDQFDDLSDAVGLMQRTQPNYTADDLARVGVPVTIVQSEHDEFIKREHAEYLARGIPGAVLVELPGVSHFAPLQRPAQFNAAILAFLDKTFAEYRAMTSESIHFRVGDFACVALPDLISRAAEDDIASIFTNDTERMLAAFRALSVPYITFCQNILLVETGDKRVLIDSGVGQADPTDPGQLLDRLGAENIAPESIDTVVISHFHLDHIGGLMDSAGHPTFPKARLVVPSREHGHWMREEILARIDPSRAARLRQTLAAYAERLTLMDDGVDIEPGIRYVPAPGHTPGHHAVRVESGDARLLHIVDTIHMPIQLNALDAAPPFDVQPDIAIATRRALLARAEAENLLLMAYHFPFPGLGYVRRRGDLLVWEPYEPPAP